MSKFDHQYVASKVREKVADLTSKQQAIVTNMVIATLQCEGLIPEKYWCRECKFRTVRMTELIRKFRRMNKIHWLLYQEPRTV